MAQWSCDVTKKEKANKAAIVFIHGFMGDSKKTWENFPELISKEQNLQDWDVLSFGYNTGLWPDLVGIWKGDPDITTVADSFNTFADVELSKYKTLVLLAHSMGGLVCQRALLDSSKLTGKVAKLMLLGTPSFGLEKASPFKNSPLLKKYKRQISDMAVGSEFITKLRKDWDSMFANLPFDFVAVSGTQDEFVPKSSSVEGFDSDLRASVPGDHLTMVKAKKASDASVRLVINFIENRNIEQLEWATADISVEVNKCREIVSARLENASSIDQKALVELSLALEVLDRKDEALQVLLGTKNMATDTYGVLAGRFKRLWFEKRLDVDVKRAIALYKRGYDLTKDSNPAQAYYHGINLAFLTLIYSNKPAPAKNMAQKVLEYCQQAKSNELPRDKVWRIATEAEANLIAQDAEQAVALYQSLMTSELSIEYRQMVSICQQALHIADYFNDDDITQKLLDVFSEKRK